MMQATQTARPCALTDAEATRAFAHAARTFALDTGMLSPSSAAAIPHAFWLIAALLWGDILRFDPKAPLWPDRDRLFVSSLRLLPLRNAFLHLPDTTTGPQATLRKTAAGMAQELFGLAGALPGQAIAAAAGMALAEKILTRRFGRSLVDHRSWLLALPGDLDTGVALEAAALADRLHLDRLTVIVADTTPSPEARADLALALDRIEASGWTVRSVDGGDLAAISTALGSVQRTRKPSLVLCTSSENPFDHAATIPAASLLGYRASLPGGKRHGTARRAWLKRLARHPLRAEFERTIQSRPMPRLEDDFRRHTLEEEAGLSLVHEGLAGRGNLASLLPEFVSLSAGHGHHALAIEAATDIAAGSPEDIIGCGPREPAMVGIMNGLALHGGILPCGIADLSSADRMRPALRFASLARRRLLFVLVEDDPFATASPPWRQVEQLASLRAMPNLALFRPADAHEVAAAWLAALAWRHGPAVLVLGREQDLLHDPFLSSTLTPPESRKPEYGGYVLAEATGGLAQRDVTLIASGPEIGVALLARQLLADSEVRAAVVSLPCWELFEQQDKTYRQKVLGNRPRVAIEAASGFGWERWLGDTGIFVGTEEFGIASGFEPLYQNSGVTPEVVCARVHDLLGMTRKQTPRAQAATLKRGGDTRRQAPPS
ncbi:transketolase-like TK C-terminal-containing protein [Acetobacter conturbans]|uniref:transketolase-like TK C-terminal-containing protein n=1 Tax=Acetobacter conturbans TaxID=1737472 RepID=UPI001F54B683|nr:transketolase [Acetobacter conturbans]